jgi:hypothetical protein
MTWIVTAAYAVAQRRGVNPVEVDIDQRGVKAAAGHCR